MENEGYLLAKEMESYMSVMDQELESEQALSRLAFEISSAEAAQSTEHRHDQTAKQELQLDMNLVENAVESYTAQLGLTGPVSNIFQSLGL